MALACCDRVQEDPIKTITGSSTAASVKAKITKIKTSKYGENEILIYGSIYIDLLNNEDGWINLTCFLLSDGEIKSDNIFIDSFFDIIQYRYPVKKGVIDARIYWSADKSLKNSIDLNKAYIEIDRDIKDCFTK